MMISNIRENGEPIGALPDGEMMFHHDMIHAEVPSKGTLLYSVEISSTGGNTLFASGYAAYDTLDPAVRNRLEGRLAKHHYNYGAVTKNDPKATAAFAESAHPFFRTHEDTGRKAIYVNRLMTVGIEGMPQAEAEPLLEAVFDHAEKPEFVYEHVWRLGDPAAVGQPLLVPCTARLPLDRAPADAAHHGQGQRAALLMFARAALALAGSARGLQGPCAGAELTRAGRSSLWCRSSPAAPPNGRAHDFAATVGQVGPARHRQQSARRRRHDRHQYRGQGRARWSYDPGPHHRLRHQRRNAEAVLRRDQGFRGDTEISSIPLMLVVHPSLPVTNVSELVALSKATSAGLDYARPAPAPRRILRARCSRR